MRITKKLIFSLVAIIISASIYLISTKVKSNEQEALKVLQEIINLSWQDDNYQMIEYLKGVPWYKGNDMQYSHLFTEKIVKKIRQQEKAAVDQYCNGKYLVGEICGLDYVPTTCSQDLIKPYNLTVENFNPYHFIIMHFYSKEQFVKYEMIKEDGKWILDNIECHY